MNFPNSLDSLTNPTGSQFLAGPPAHSLQHGNANDIIEAIEDVLVGPVFINVKGRSYGAKGDSVTDDTAAIQAAIDSFATPSTQFGQGGGTVLLPAGTYRIPTGLTIPRGVHLVGVGQLASILAYEGTGVAITLTADASFGHNWSQFRDFQLRGNQTTNQAGNHAIQIAGTTGANLDRSCVLSHLYIRNFGDTAFVLNDRAYGVVIDGGYVEQCKRVVSAIGAMPAGTKWATENVVRDLTCLSIREWCFYIEGGEVPSFTNCHTDDAPGSGFAYFKDNYVTASDNQGPPGGLYSCRVEAIGAGDDCVVLDNTHGVNIRDCSLLNSAASGGVAGVAVRFKNAASQNHIENNSFPSDAGGMNIYFDDANSLRNVIRHNSVKSTMTAKRHVGAEAFLTLAGNHIEESLFCVLPGLARIITASGTTSLSRYDHAIRVNATAGAVTVELADNQNLVFQTLPITITKTDASVNAVTIQPPGALSIEGGNITLADQFDSVTLMHRPDATQSTSNGLKQYTMSNGYYKIASIGI